MKKAVNALLIIFISIVCFSCIQFGMSREEAAEYFKDKELKPNLYTDTTSIGILSYAHLDSDKKNLVLFVHGAPGSLNAFIGFLGNKSLQEKTNMISIDRPGYGGSNEGKAAVSLKGQSDYIVEILKRHPVEGNIILVGHSLGGPIIAKVAMDYPQLVDGLIIVGGSIDPEMEVEEWYRPYLRGSIAKSILPGALWVTNEEIFHLKDELSAMLNDWKAISIPTTVIQGAEDGLVPKENAYFAQIHIPAEYLEVWLEQDVNHFIPWNQPELIQQAIMLHLSDGNWRRESK